MAAPTIPPGGFAPVWRRSLPPSPYYVGEASQYRTVAPYYDMVRNVYMGGPLRRDQGRSGLGADDARTAKAYALLLAPGALLGYALARRYGKNKLLYALLGAGASFASIPVGLGMGLDLFAGALPLGMGVVGAGLLVAGKKSRANPGRRRKRRNRRRVRRNPPRCYVRTRDGNYGPYSRASAMDYARVRSQSGGSTEVLCGGPTNGTLVRVYEKGRALFRDRKGY